MNFVQHTLLFSRKILCTSIPWHLNFNFLPCSRLLLCTQESENVLATNASVISPNGGQYMWLKEDMVNDTFYIPAWWHHCITGVGQQYDSMKEVRLALIYYSIEKKCVYDFVKNDTRRITIKCSNKETISCAWRLHVSPLSSLFYSLYSPLLLCYIIFPFFSPSLFCYISSSFSSFFSDPVLNFSVLNFS